MPLFSGFLFFSLFYSALEKIYLNVYKPVIRFLIFCFKIFLFKSSFAFIGYFCPITICSILWMQYLFYLYHVIPFLCFLHILCMHIISYHFLFSVCFDFWLSVWKLSSIYGIFCCWFIFQNKAKNKSWLKVACWVEGLHSLELGLADPAFWGLLIFSV